MNKLQKNIHKTVDNTARAYIHVCREAGGEEEMGKIHTLIAVTTDRISPTVSDYGKASITYQKGD